MAGREIAERQLDRILGFFPRLDAKASALFAIDAAMLGVLSASLSADSFERWQLGLPVLAAFILLGASLCFLYVCGFPHTKGGQGSLVYFGEIAARTEAKFISEAKEVSSEAFTDDLLGQIWRNSDILKIKFAFLKRAFIATAASLIPWCASIALATV